MAQRKMDHFFTLAEGKGATVGSWKAAVLIHEEESMKISLRRLSNPLLKLMSILLIVSLILPLLTSCAQNQSQNGKVVMENLIQVIFEGKDGAGTPGFQIDKGYLEDVYAEGEFDVNSRRYVERYINSLNVEFEPAENLSNGDKVTVEVKDDESLLKKAKLARSDMKFTCQVSGLQLPEKVDPFTVLSSPVFEGQNGEGKAKIADIEPFSFSVTPDSKLSNGDKVTVKLTNDEASLKHLGYIASKTEKEYTVSGLQEIKDYNPFSHIHLNFTGYNGDGEAEVENESEWGSQQERFGLSKSDHLSNGEEITVTLLNSPESLKEQGWNPQEKEKIFKVTGLREREELDPFDYFQLKVEGYSGDGVAQWTNLFNDDDIEFSVSKSDKLSNGDTIVAKLVTSPQYFLDAGYTLSQTEKEYNVENLAEYTTITATDILDNLTVLYYGCDPYIVAEIKAPESGVIADYLHLQYRQAYYSNGDTVSISVEVKNPETMQNDGYKLAEEARTLQIQIGEQERPVVLQNLDSVDKDTRAELEKAAQGLFRANFASLYGYVYIDNNANTYYKYDLTVNPGASLEWVYVYKLKSSVVPEIDDVIKEKGCFNRFIYEYKMDAQWDKNGEKIPDIYTMVCLSNVLLHPDGSISYDSDKSFTVSRPDSPIILFAGKYKEEFLLGTFGQNYTGDSFSAADYWNAAEEAPETAEAPEEETKASNELEPHASEEETKASSENELQANEEETKLSSENESTVTEAEEIQAPVEGESQANAEEQSEANAEELTQASEQVSSSEKNPEDATEEDLSTEPAGPYDFDLRFLKLINPQENTVFSPLSIKYALSMLNEGSAGETKAQISDLLADFVPEKYINNEHFSLANALFIRDTMKEAINDSYPALLSSKYGAEAVFDPFTSAKNTNAWIEDNTLGLIKNLLSDSDLQEANFALINALAIDMEWMKHFDACTFGYPHTSFWAQCGYGEEGRPTPFANMENKIASMDILAAIGNYDIVNELGRDAMRATVAESFREYFREFPFYIDEYAEYGTDVESIIENYLDQNFDQYIEEIDRNYGRVDYSTDFSMYADEKLKVFAKNLQEYEGLNLQYVGIMPLQEDLDKFIQNLDSVQIQTILAELKELKSENFKQGVVTKITGEIPRFSFDYQLDLRNCLNNLGVTDVFDSERADLSSMIEGQSAYIDQAFHSANIAFSHEGIKAAATTFYGGAAAAGDPFIPFSYHFDVPVEEIDLSFNRPYLFFILDKDSGEIWFSGAVYEPSIWEGDEKNFYPNYKIVDMSDYEIHSWERPQEKTSNEEGEVPDLKDHQFVEITADSGNALSVLLAGGRSRNGYYVGALDSEGKPHGIGAFTSQNSKGHKWTYSGEWEHGAMRGKGIQVFEKYNEDAPEVYWEGDFDGELVEGLVHSVEKDLTLRKWQGKFQFEKLTQGIFLVKTPGGIWVYEKGSFDKEQKLNKGIRLEKYYDCKEPSGFAYCAFDFQDDHNFTHYFPKSNSDLQGIWLGHTITDGVAAENVEYPGPPDFWYEPTEEDFE